MYRWAGGREFFSWSVATPHSPLVAVLIGGVSATLVGLWLLAYSGKFNYPRSQRALVSTSLIWLGFGAGLFGPAALGLKGSWETVGGSTDEEIAFAGGFSAVPVNPLSSPSASIAYQTRCPVEGVSFDGWDSDSTELALSITKLGKPHEGWMSSYLYTESNEVKVVEYARTSDEVYAIREGSFEAEGVGGCDPTFRAFGFVFTSQDSTISACQDDACQEIAIADGTGVLTYAAGGGAVLAGTNHGDLLRFDTNGWCRMTAVEEDSVYQCLDNSPDSNVEPRMQWYGSVPYGENSLVGDYPIGAIWLFDGETFSRSQTILPEKIRQPLPQGEFAAPGGGYWGEAYEIQALAFYCGALWAGNWPHGELLRFDGVNWTKPFSLFTQSELPELWSVASEAGESFNYLGKRVNSLVAHEGRLYVGTSNKWPSQTQNGIELSSDLLAEYGNIHIVSDAKCVDSNPH